MSDLATISEFAAQRGIEMPEAEARLFMQARKLAADPETNAHVRAAAKKVLDSFGEWFRKGGQRRFTFSEFFLPVEDDE